jgi:2-iminobutanoate/2-iminopropanoate deaminase
MEGEEIMIKQAITSERVPKSKNPFSQGIKANGFLYISGQVGKDSSGNIVEGFSQQVRLTMENIKSIVEEAGSSMNDLVKATIYLTDISRMAELNEIYREYFDGDFPARATVEVSRLGLTAEVEIEAIAVCKG